MHDCYKMFEEAIWYIVTLLCNTTRLLKFDYSVEFCCFVFGEISKLLNHLPLVMIIICNEIFDNSVRYSKYLLSLCTVKVSLVWLCSVMSSHSGLYKSYLCACSGTLTQGIVISTIWISHETLLEDVRTNLSVQGNFSVMCESHHLCLIGKSKTKLQVKKLCTGEEF